MGAERCMIVEPVEEGSPTGAGGDFGVPAEKSDSVGCSRLGGSRVQDVLVFQEKPSPPVHGGEEVQGCGVVETVRGLSPAAVSASEYPPEPERQADPLPHTTSPTPSVNQPTPEGGRRVRNWRVAISGALGRGGGWATAPRAVRDRKAGGGAGRSLRERGRGLAERSKDAKEQAATRAREVLNSANRVLSSAGNRLKSGTKLPSLGRSTAAGARRGSKESSSKGSDSPTNAGA